LIPKGAIICIILGIIGSGLVGIFFLEIANQPLIPIHVLGPSLSVITEKTNFHLGEPIHIKIVNSGTVPLTFSDASYGLKIKQLDGIVLYSPISAQVISVLKPEEEKTFVWNQTKLDGSKIIEGTYNIVSSTDSSSDNMLKKSITINIFK
jgi:hypothetical protein